MFRNIKRSYYSSALKKKNKEIKKLTEKLEKLQKSNEEKDKDIRSVAEIKDKYNSELETVRRLKAETDCLLRDLKQAKKDFEDSRHEVL